MIIRSLHLQNYRLYQDQLVEFPNGLIGIVGKNGAGKSTLIEAIGWCLYGNNAARTTKEEIKRTGAGPRDDCKVTLEFTLGDDSLRIERELRGSNASGMASLFLNGNSRPEVSGVLEVSNYIARRTGMDYVAFFTSVFAKQKELNALSDLQPGKRKETIMRLLRIDKVDDVISNIRADMRSSKDKIDFIRPTLKDLNVLLKEAEGLGEEKANKISEINTSNKEMSILKKSVKIEKSNFTLQEKKYKQYNKINSKIGNLIERQRGKEGSKSTAQGDLAAAKRSRDDLEKIQPQVIEFDNVKVEKEILNGLYIKFNNKRNLERQIREVDTKIKGNILQNKKLTRQLHAYENLDKYWQNNSKNLIKLQRKKESLDALFNQVKAKIKGQISLKNKAEDEFSKIKGLGKKSKCPTCKRPLGEHLGTITKHFESEIRKFDRIIATANGEKRDLSNGIRDVVSKIKNLKDHESGLKTKSKTRTQLAASLKGETRNLKGYKKQLASLKIRLRRFANIKYDKGRHDKVKADFSRLTKIKNKSIGLQRDVERIPILESRISSLSKSITELEAMIANTRELLDKVGFDNSEYEAAKKSLNTANKNFQDKRLELTELRGELKQTMTKIRQNKQTILEEKEKKRTVETEEKKIASRSKLEKIMIDFKSDLISRIRPMLSSRASELFREVTNGKYPSMDLDEEYNIRIEDEGATFGINRFSGGEEDLANLCLRVAISQELSERAGGSRANFIALDEIFGSQDSERKNNILKALTELSNQFRQIFVITHVEDVKESLPFVLNVKEDSDNKVKIEMEGMKPAIL